MSPSPAPRLVLASRSPQRRAILAKLGLEFEVRPADVQEREQGYDLGEVALGNAIAKADAAARDDPAEVVLGVDTVVWLEGRVYGKPRDAAEAAAGLRALSGATHLVVSGLALVRAPDLVQTVVAETRVTFRELDQGLIDWYLATEEWRDRAGGYAIQGAGAALVTRVEGDYENVVGLPVAALLDLWPNLLARVSDGPGVGA